jgi:pimeloyl-ACP methyl ester carboxylesterase
VVTLATHDGSTTRYAFSSPSGGDSAAVPITLVLLPGGPGYVALDDGGCPQKLKGNSLVRSLPAFAAQGLATALIDAPSDYQGADGLGGFRTAAEHADDLGQVIASLRRRTGGKVWVVGTSRGSISAANAAARLSGGSAPDGVVLTSALMSGQTAAKKRWVAQTVFDLALESIRLPLLVVGHADDRCVRSPPALMAQVAARTRSSRQEVVSVTGGSGASGLAGLDACEANAAHGFIGQESELAAGIARFVRGGGYQER